MPSALPDWLELASEPSAAEPLVDSRSRLRWGTRLFVLGGLVVLARAAQLESTQGEIFRLSAAQPIVRRHSLEGIRGRILARDGTVLAIDEERPALAVRYRQLEDPPDPFWLRRQARASLTRVQRKDAALVAAAEEQILADRRALHDRLARLCGLSLHEWQQRAGRVQQRVERLSRTVNDRQRSHLASRVDDLSRSERTTMWQRLTRRLDEFIWSAEGPTAPILVAEELDHHVLAENVPLEVVAEVEGHPDLYPGVRIEPRRRRHYPQGPLAAHLIGHLGAADARSPEQHPDDRVGRLGLELQHEALLRGRRGAMLEHVHRTGEVVHTQREQEPSAGRDVTLTLDLALQRTAEALLDSACQRRDALAADSRASGGAVVVLDVHSGAVLAAASAPRFDPNWFAAAGQARSEEQVARLLADPSHPMFDRVSRMALAPGSVFKPITAAALLEAAGIDRERPFPCQGYLHRPDAQRCMIYTRRGIGHGDVNLSDALAVSCNVYFFEAAGAMGAQPLCDWAARFGLGRPTGIDLPGESAGYVPQPEAGRWKIADTQALAIGQSRLTVTPLQMARVMAALANGGLLVRPHVLNSISPDDGLAETAAPQPIAGLTRPTLAALHDGLKRVVADPAGSAHETVYLEHLAIAGKTGTAQAGGDLPDHAWFAAWCPADAPKAALVVVLEHAGEGSLAAGPVARRLIERMLELGYFVRSPSSSAPTAPGRGTTPRTSRISNFE